MHLILYILHAVVLCTQVYSQLNAQLVLLPLYVSAVNRSLLQGATSVEDIYSVLLSSVSQPPSRGPVPDPGINYTGPREG